MVLSAAPDELRMQLERAGATVQATASADEAAELVRRIAPDALVLDADAHDATSLSKLVRQFAPLPVIAAGRGDVQQIVTAVRGGARNYLALPCDGAALDAIADALFAASDEDASEPDGVEELLGKSKPMQSVHDTIRQVAPKNVTVLVRGETGTGKELVARALHELSGRKGPFVKVHCAGLPESLLESELFGYERGAFTGASGRRLGRVEVAEGGTLFFDEIGEIAPAVQVKLLRLLQDRQYERLGSNTPLDTSARFVAATHRKLDDMVKRGEFRADLYYRLEVVKIHVPALRQRREDVPELAARFCATLAELHGRPGLTFSKDALDALSGQPWPGNVRQLRNFVERLVVLTRSTVIDAKEVARELAPENDFVTNSLAPGSPSVSLPSRTGPVVPIDLVRREAERQAILNALRFTKGNKELAAKYLGMSRANIFRKITAFDIKYEPANDNEDGKNPNGDGEGSPKPR